MSSNLGFKLVLSDDDSARLREILAAQQEVSLTKQPIWVRFRSIFAFLVLITLLAGSVVFGQTDFVQAVVSDLIEAVIKCWGWFLG